MLRNSFEGRRRKARERGLKGTQQASVLDQFADNTPQAKDLSADHLRRTLQQVALAFKEERSLRVDLQDKIDAIYSRNLQREQQFRTLLQEAIPFCKNQGAQNIQVSSLQRIKDMLLQFFEENNEKVQKKMELEGRELEGVMDRKVSKITEHMNSELQKRKALLELNHRTIGKEIKQVIRLSESILDENDQFRKSIHELTLKNQILKSEKDLLIAQMMDKKDLIVRMFKASQKGHPGFLERGHKHSQESRKRCETKEYSNPQLNLFDQEEEAQWRSKELSSKKNTIESNKANQSTNETCQSTLGLRPPKSKHPRRVMTTNSKHSFAPAQASFQPLRTQPFLRENSQGRGERELAELRQAIRVERGRNAELSKRLKQYIVQQQEMGKVLSGLFDMGDEREGEGPRDEGLQMKVAKNSGKIYHMIKELEKRLLSSASPAINSGFNQLNNLLTEFQEESDS